LVDDTIEAIRTPKEFNLLPPAGKEARILSDRLIHEINVADIIVFGIPMYNFTIPASLKGYIDYIARLGLTFGYDMQTHRPIPMIKGKTVLTICVGGGHYIGTS
jgi:FMN-dependent NADH-azoreductase